MLIKGRLIAESPIYRGNARKTLFTRDGDGTQRLVSLAGVIGGTAQSLMDAFIGGTADGRNIGLLNRLWRRLYASNMPNNLITQVTCELDKATYTRERFFDMRMGLKLDEDRWASEANANYKMETVFRNAVFDLQLFVDDAMLAKGQHAAQLYYLLQELQAGRFWFGAGKSKGLGRLRLELETPLPAPKTPPALQPEANHLSIELSFDATNPVLVGWNWGKVDPEVPSFAAIEGRLLIAAMRDLPEEVRQRLESVLSGPILNAEDWKRQLDEFLPRALAIWLQSQGSGEIETWVLTKNALDKLAKGKYALSKAVIDAVTPLCEQPFPSQEAAEAAFVEALGNKANMAGRLIKVLESRRETRYALPAEIWATLTEDLGLDPALEARITPALGDEAALVALLKPACAAIMPRLHQQVDQQINLLQSDAWIDAEIASREAHLAIKMLLLEGKIREADWESRTPPQGVSTQAWQTFKEEHRRVRYRHLTDPRNLRKSIVNDRNFIAFLRSYRNKARQELSQPYHVDFRSGGPFNREVARKYGKPYDTIFMRMLTWSPSNRSEGAWEVYIPGSSLKGAFRRRASQILKTLESDSGRIESTLDRLFGRQGQTGLIYFSDAYLTDPLDPEKAWCSMDGVRMNPATGQPIETAKSDYLFAYGEALKFHLRLDLQDLRPEDVPALQVFFHLLQDFQDGDIVIGGEKTSGFGWVKARIEALHWLTGSVEGVSRTLFGDHPLTTEDAWQSLQMKGEEAVAALTPRKALTLQRSIQVPPTAQEGYISHRAFGGNCGMLTVEAEVLTPLHIRESGEPSQSVSLPDGPVAGWDFFSMSPPEAAQREEIRRYALPAKSLRGMIRHLYAIVSDSTKESGHITQLNPADALFGWVGKGTNQALMGRVTVGFGIFEPDPQLSWYKVPYPYTGWLYAPAEKTWLYEEERNVPRHQIAASWRLFRHAPLAPIARPLESFAPDTAQASYFRAILPGARARFTVRFWNLEDLELQRLIWSIALEPGLAHKIGHHRYLGFGSLRLNILPESYLIDWSKRYAGGEPATWQQPLKVEDWIKPRVISHYIELQKALDAGAL